MKFSEQLPTASDEKSGMKQRKDYLEKENEAKTAQTLGHVREGRISLSSVKIICNLS
jgi:hypothetical protein